MEISRQDIQKLGELARLELREEEIDLLSEQLPKIVTYVSQLHQVDTVTTPGEESTLYSGRRDEAHPSSVTDDILTQAPEREGSAWKVDAVFS